MRVTAARQTAAFAAVLGLTALTLGLSFVPLGAWGMPVALAIAGAKALIVMAFFMHLAEEGVSMRAAIAVGVGMLALLATLAAVDVATRAPPPLLPPVAD